VMDISTPFRNSGNGRFSEEQKGATNGHYDAREFASR
jgi:hypothetical protein